MSLGSVSTGLPDKCSYSRVALMRQSTQRDPARRRAAIAGGVEAAWGVGQRAEAYAALRRLGSGSKRRRYDEVRPTLHDPEDSLVDGNTVCTRVAAA
eukprot:3934279-Pyramimonas_sp.AAC.1